MEKNYENYEIIEINRQQLKKAPYNPRKISEQAKRKLKENIKKIGLLNPPVWNEVTGNIVSGHQRIDILDSLFGTDDYKLKVAKVSLDEKTEKEQNIFFNNPEAMGEWDMAKLEELFTVDKIDSELAGFDVVDVYQLFGDNPLHAQPDKLLALSEQLKKSKETFKNIEKKLTESYDDYDCYCVVVFKDYQTRKNFTDSLNLPDNRFIDGKNLLQLIVKNT